MKIGPQCYKVFHIDADESHHKFQSKFTCYEEAFEFAVIDQSCVYSLTVTETRLSRRWVPMETLTVNSVEIF